MEEDDNVFQVWGIVELLGHVRLAGLVSEEERFGGKLGRIDIPLPDKSFITQYFSHSSLYRFTPCSQEIAESVAKQNYPSPMHLLDFSIIESLPSEDF